MSNTVEGATGVVLAAQLRWSPKSMGRDRRGGDKVHFSLSFSRHQPNDQNLIYDGQGTVWVLLIAVE